MYHFFFYIILFTSYAVPPEPIPPSPVPFPLNKKPTEQGLLYISGEIMQDWKSVCTVLYISYAKISECTANNPGNVKQACHSALLWWLENSESPPTWATS